MSFCRKRRRIHSEEGGLILTPFFLLTILFFHPTVNNKGIFLHMGKRMPTFKMCSSSSALPYIEKKKSPQLAHTRSCANFINITRMTKKSEILFTLTWKGRKNCNSVKIALSGVCTCVLIIELVLFLSRPNSSQFECPEIRRFKDFGALKYWKVGPR